MTSIGIDDREQQLVALSLNSKLNGPSDEVSVVSAREGVLMQSPYWKLGYAHIGHSGYALGHMAALARHGKAEGTLRPFAHLAIVQTLEACKAAARIRVTRCAEHGGLECFVAATEPCPFDPPRSMNDGTLRVASDTANPISAVSFTAYWFIA